jgi:hypothetical protein
VYFGALGSGIAVLFLSIVSAMALADRMAQFMVLRTSGQQASRRKQERTVERKREKSEKIERKMKDRNETKRNETRALGGRGAQ